MAEPTHHYTRLPGKLRNELGISKAEYDGARRSRNGPGRRKELRKAARVEQKTNHVPVKRAAPTRRGRRPVETSNEKTSAVTEDQRPDTAASVRSKAPKSILKAPKAQPISSSPTSPPPKVTRRVRNKLAEDDAEIAALEQVLGVKGKAKLPKSFEDDGLDDLLEGLDDAVDTLDGRLGKRKRTEEYEWLEKKRQKAQTAREDEGTAGSDEEPAHDGEEDEMRLPWKLGVSSLGGDEEHEEDTLSLEEDDDAMFDGLGKDENEGKENPFSDDEGHFKSEPAVNLKRYRENPYIAPVTAATEAVAEKYVPPYLRKTDPKHTEDLSHLRKQVQGLLNRLSEANMLSIVGDVEKLYQSNPRQHVSATILDVMLGLLSDPSSLQDTFIILHAGFIGALYKIVGTEFGAQAVQRIDEEFARHYENDNYKGGVDKRLVNLTNLFAELYNFQVVGSALIYDLVRLFLTELSETNTELLLKIIRNAGPQLRQDDPSSLKAIVTLLQEQISTAGEDTVSTKIKFMMETMNNLKNNRMKTGIAASTISSEHTTRMKKTLGTMNQKQIKASEPLRVGLNDLRESDRRGKWWLVGSSYKDEGRDTAVHQAQSRQNKHDNIDDASFDKDITVDLAQLAKEQRMNTSIRQSIFIAIMSSTDYNDAYLRVTKLRLKKAQELEIPKVLIHCSGAEKVYNPFYTLLARRLCSDRKLKMAFQFSLWDLFKQMGEQGEESGDEDEDENEGKLGLRAVVNLARMFGSLIADGGLSLSVLKNLSLGYLQPKTHTFVEILLITVILQSQKNVEGARDETAILNIFLRPKEMTDMARGLHYFLKKTMSKSDVVGGRHDRETVRWGCTVASSALKGLMSKSLYEA